jgi:RimJ/RimL family protein N-acetyltransferase
MRVEQLSAEEWSSLSEDAHRVVFGSVKPASLDRIDFALLVVDEEHTPMGYVTCREWDRDTLYWQFGGMFPGTKETIHSFAVFQALIAWCRPRYQRLTALVENSNTPMLKMAMKVGYRITGVRTFQGSVLLEHLLEFPHGT